MDLKAATRRGENLLAGRGIPERAAGLVSTTMVGTTFGPGLLPRRGLDQALATGIVAATNHGLVTTSQSACAALARRFVRDDGTPSDRVRAYAAQAAVSAGVAVAGAATERVLAPRPAEPVHRAALRTVGRRGFRVGLAGAALAAVAAADAAVGGRRPGLRLLAASGGLLGGAVLAGWQIRRFYGGEQADPSRLGPPADPLADETVAGEAAPEHVPLPPVARSLLLGAAVSTGLHVISLAESALGRRATAPGQGGGPTPDQDLGIDGGRRRSGRRSGLTRSLAVRAPTAIVLRTVSWPVLSPAT